MHIISPSNAPWCGWIMLLLLVCGILSEWLQPGIITKCHITITARITDRMYKEAPTSFMGQIFIALFRIGTLAMALCLSFDQGNNFPFVNFAIIFGLIIGVLLLKMICNVLLDYTFELSRRFGEAYEHYANIFTITSLVLYPILLVLLRLNNVLVGKWVLASIALLFIGLWIYRSIRTYVSSFPTLMYWTIYICTLELLPMAALVYLSAKMLVVL